MEKATLDAFDKLINAAIQCVNMTEAFSCQLLSEAQKLEVLRNSCMIVFYMTVKSKEQLGAFCKHITDVADTYQGYIDYLEKKYVLPKTKKWETPLSTGPSMLQKVTAIRMFRKREGN
jgi:hypothetical protein